MSQTVYKKMRGIISSQKQTKKKSKQVSGKSDSDLYDFTMKCPDFGRHHSEEWRLEQWEQIDVDLFLLVPTSRPGEEYQSNIRE